MATRHSVGGAVVTQRSSAMRLLRPVGVVGASGAFFVDGHARGRAIRWRRAEHQGAHVGSVHGLRQGEAAADIHFM